MSRVLTNENNYYDIADTIRQMKNVNTTYKPREMASALKDIYSNEVEGVPPLSFEANGNNLLDYRIDGASGGVGDRTDNLFDGILLDGYYTDNTLTTLTSSTGIYKSLKVNLPAGTYTVVYSEAVLIIRYIELNGDYMTNPAGKSTVESYTFTLNSNSTISLGFRNSTNTQWDDSIKIQVVTGSIVPSKYEPYGYKVPVIISGKNLLPTPEVKSQTVNGVTISRFVNGIITIKGTPTAQMDVKFNFEESTFSAGSYIHLRNNFSTYNFAVSFRKDGVNKIAPGLGTLNSIKQITEDITVNQMVVLCNNNAVGTNYDITIQPSIELTNEETSYEPYHEPITTNIYLDNPILENESISLSDTNVDIPTIDGTNVISIDTTVQPSNVYIQAPKDTPKMIEARERLEVI